MELAGGLGPQEVPAGLDPVKFPDQAQGGQGLPKSCCQDAVRAEKIAPPTAAPPHGPACPGVLNVCTQAFWGFWREAGHLGVPSTFPTLLCTQGLALVPANGLPLWLASCGFGPWELGGRLERKGTETGGSSPSLHTLAVSQGLSNISDVILSPP